MDFNAVLTPNPQCPVREIGSGLVIMAPEGDTTHSLEDLGAFIWHQLDGQKDLNTVLAAIMKEYEVEEETARQDLQSFATQLRDSGLVTVA